MTTSVTPQMLGRSVTLATSWELSSLVISLSLISAARARQERPRHEQWPHGASALHPETQHRPGGAWCEDGQGAGAD